MAEDRNNLRVGDIIIADHIRCFMRELNGKILAQNSLITHSLISRRYTAHRAALASGNRYCLIKKLGNLLRAKQVFADNKALFLIVRGKRGVICHPFIPLIHSLLYEAHYIKHYSQFSHIQADWLLLDLVQLR